MEKAGFDVVLDGDVDVDVVGRRWVLAKAASEGVPGMSRSGRLVLSSSSSGQSKALKTEGLLSSKKVWDEAGAVLRRWVEREGRCWKGMGGSLLSSKGRKPNSTASSKFEGDASQRRTCERASKSW